MLYINPIDCIDCGACQPACPVTAIFPEGEVPEAETRFTQINALWFDDRGAARAELATDIAPVVTADDVAVPGDDGSEGAAAEAGALPYRQVAAAADHQPAPVQQRGPSPAGFVSLTLFALSFIAMVLFPGPSLIEPAGTDFGIGATIVLLAPLAVIFALIFIRSQWMTLASFSAAGGRREAKWRSQVSEWRRSEESRSADLSGIVQSNRSRPFPLPERGTPRAAHLRQPARTAARDRGTGRHREAPARHRRPRSPRRTTEAGRAGRIARDPLTRAGRARLGQTAAGRCAAAALRAGGAGSAGQGLRSPRRDQRCPDSHLASPSNRRTRPRGPLGPVIEARLRPSIGSGADHIVRSLRDAAIGLLIGRQLPVGCGTSGGGWPPPPRARAQPSGRPCSSMPGISHVSTRGRAAGGGTHLTPGGPLTSTSVSP